MPMGKLLSDPVSDAQRSAESEAGPPRLRRIEAALAQRPALPLIALAIVGFGLTLIIVLTVIAGLLSDNFGPAWIRNWPHGRSSPGSVSRSSPAPP